MRKITSTSLMFLGMVLIIMFGVNMFTFFTMNDTLWLLMFFAGITLFSVGGVIDKSMTLKQKDSLYHILCLSIPISIWLIILLVK